MKMYSTLAELQQDLDIWLHYYNTKRAHSGKYCNGKTPIKTFFDGIELAKNYYIDKGSKSENIEKENDEYICDILILCLLIMGREMNNNCKIIDKPNLLCV